LKSRTVHLKAAENAFWNPILTVFEWQPDA
jgi:hypothetical protein